MSLEHERITLGTLEKDPLDLGDTFPTPFLVEQRPTSSALAAIARIDLKAPELCWRGQRERSGLPIHGAEGEPPLLVVKGHRDSIAVGDGRDAFHAVLAGFGHEEFGFLSKDETLKLSAVEVGDFDHRVGARSRIGATGAGEGAVGQSAERRDDDGDQCKELRTARGDLWKALHWYRKSEEVYARGRAIFQPGKTVDEGVEAAFQRIIE
jgi:hypothetical protein